MNACYNLLLKLSQFWQFLVPIQVSCIMVKIWKIISLFNFVINDGLCPNLALCYEINAHMNDIIVQYKVLFWLVKLCHIFAIPTKGLKKAYSQSRHPKGWFNKKKKTINDYFGFLLHLLFHDHNGLVYDYN